MKFFCAFFFAATLDYFWAWYIKAVADGHALAAAALSATIGLFGGMLVLAYVQTPDLLLAICGGYFAGTYLKVKLK